MSVANARVTRARRLARCPASLLAAGILAGGVLAGATVPAAKAASLKAPVPASLRAVESSAEDILDAALAGERGEVVAKAASLKAAANGPAAAALARSGLSSAKVGQLKQRANRVAQLAARGSFTDVALAANAVSQLMPDFYGRFQDPVPAPVLKLDYLDREALLHSLATTVKELERTWVRLRPAVIAAGAAKEAAAYDRHVAALKRLAPGAGKNVQTEADRGLNLVDQLEQAFLR